MTQISEATAIYLGTTAVDKVYLGEALIWSAAPPPAMTAELVPVVNDWTALDLAASLPASVGFPTFAITSGSLPAGYTLDPASGMLSGVSTTGDAAASVTVTAGAAETVVSIAAPRREMSNITTGGAYLTRPSALGLTEGPGLRRKMTFAARFTIPTDIAASARIFELFGRSQFQVFSSGKVNIKIMPPASSIPVVEWTSTGSVSDGLEHTLVVTADLNDIAPTMEITLDGAPWPGSFSTAPSASEIAVNRNGYGVGAFTGGTVPLPANAALRWLYVSFDDAIPGAAFEGVADPASLGSPSLFFGGLAADWNAGTNFGAVGGAFTATGTFIAQGAEAVVDPTPRAFPGATGHGRYTTGGRGGATIRVTSSADTGPGSLREALTTPGARYVIIEPGVGPVWLESGEIDIPALTHGDLTIDARRAPGFFLSMARLTVRASNVLVRGLRIYAGGEAGQPATQSITGATGTAGNMTGLPAEYWEWGDTRGQNGEQRHCIWLGDYTNESSTWSGAVQTRVYLDHCDFGWAPDKAITIFPLRQSFAPDYVGPTPCSDITIDGCIAFESLFGAHYNPESKTILDSLLVLVGERCARISFHGNLFATAAARFPALNSYCRDMELVNSWNANWGPNGTQLSGTYDEGAVTAPLAPENVAARVIVEETQSQLNIVRCVFDEGGATLSRPGGRSPVVMQADIPDRLHIADLVWNDPGGSAVTLTELKGLVRTGAGQKNAAGVLNGPIINISPTPVTPLRSTPLPPEVDLRAWVAANVGARNPDGSLHPIAARIVAQATARTLPSWAASPSEGWPATENTRGGPRGQWKVSWATETSTAGQTRLDRPDDAHLIYSPGGALKAAVS